MFPLKDTIPNETAPLINSLFIILCTFVFLHEFSMAPGELDHFLDAWGVVPALLTNNWSPHEMATVFSSMFLHAGWDHLIGNMWFLYLFGDNVEDRFGHVAYFFFYLFCGFVAAMTQVLISPNSHVAMVGASGAISGVLGAYFVFYPQSKIITLFLMGIFSRLVEVPAVIFLGLWFAMQFLTGLGALAIASPQEAGGVAFWAHVGGFVSGFVIAQFMPKPEYYS